LRPEKDSFPSNFGLARSGTGGAGWKCQRWTAATVTTKQLIRSRGRWSGSIPRPGQTHFVYERINPDRGGPKWQIFAINDDRTGLGRLYDGRPNRDTRTSSGGLKFPLGLWKQGESKKLEYKIYEGARDSSRVESITIKQIDFALGNDAHCLEFYWTVTDGSEKKLYDHHTYAYCPGKSMVHEIQH